jgi:hypothetical protein
MAAVTPAKAVSVLGPAQSAVAELIRAMPPATIANRSCSFSLSWSDVLSGNLDREELDHHFLAQLMTNVQEPSG